MATWPTLIEFRLEFRDLCVVRSLKKITRKTSYLPSLSESLSGTDESIQFWFDLDALKQEIAKAPTRGFLPKGTLLTLFLPLAVLFSGVAQSCPGGISYQSCSNCHSNDGGLSYTASWSSIPTVLERNATDTITFSMSGTGADDAGFSARINTGTSTSTSTLTATGQAQISSTNVSHSAPDLTARVPSSGA